MKKTATLMKKSLTTETPMERAFPREARPRSSRRRGDGDSFPAL